VNSTPADDRCEPKEAPVFHTRFVPKVALAALALSVPLAACGDDEEAATALAATTTVHVVTTEPVFTTPASMPEDVAALIEHLDTVCAGDDPGFDQFMTEHPEPTAEDWAAFLPQPIQMLTEVTACIADSDPPALLVDEIDAVVAAMTGVRDKTAEALAAAQAGDLEEVNALLEVMNADLVQTMHDAEAAFFEAVQGQ
jgi:hypothetical protein